MAVISRRHILAKVEVTQGTDAVPTPALDGVDVENPVFAWEESTFFEPNPARRSFGAEAAKRGGELGTLTFDVNLKGSGAAGTPPDLGVLLRGCGLGETIVASTSVTYAPVSENIETLTLYFYDDGKLLKLLGSIGEVSLAAPAQEAAKLTFTFTGHVVDWVDAALPDPTVQSTEAPVFIGASFTVDGFAAEVANLTLAMGNEISKNKNVNSPDGFGDLRLTGRKLTGTFDPLDTLVATYDWVAKWKANTLANLTTGAIGSAGNRWQLTVPRAQYMEIAPGDRESVSSLEVTYNGVINLGDDEMSLVFD